MHEIDTYEVDDIYARLWQPARDERMLFITYMTADSATRYDFELTDEENNICNYTKGNGEIPPRDVVELLNNNDFTVKNLPNITETHPGKKAKQIADSIDWFKKYGNYEPDGIRKFAYSRASKAMQIIYVSALATEVVGPEGFLTAVRTSLTRANADGVQISTDNLLDPSTHTIEFLQKLLIDIRKSLPRPQQERIVELAEEHYGMVAYTNSDEPDVSWQSTTTSESSEQFHPDAVAQLKSEGWLADGDFKNM